MRLFAAAMSVLALTSPSLAAEIDCLLEHGRYEEPEGGYVLQFRPIEAPTAPVGMILAVFDITKKDRDWTLPGFIASNMGINRDEGSAYFQCPVADPEYGALDYSQDCQVWNGVVYALVDDEMGVDFVGAEGDPAPLRLLLTDFGRQIRYSDVGRGPEDGGWDVFHLVGCAP